MLTVGTPTRLPFTFVHSRGHAGKSPGHAGETNKYCGRCLIYKIKPITHNEKTRLNCK